MNFQTDVELNLFLQEAPRSMRENEQIKKFQMNNGESIHCVLWKGHYYITGTDIVKVLIYKFQLANRHILNTKKFEEGVFSDLRNLKAGVDAKLEAPRSEFLEFLYKNGCIRTQKKQKVFFWYSVPHDALFCDALERDIKRETNLLTINNALNTVNFAYHGFLQGPQMKYMPMNVVQQGMMQRGMQQPMVQHQMPQQMVQHQIPQVVPPQMVPQQMVPPQMQHQVQQQPQKGTVQRKNSDEELFDFDVSDIDGGFDFDGKSMPSTETFYHDPIIKKHPEVIYVSQKGMQSNVPQNTYSDAGPDL